MKNKILAIVAVGMLAGSISAQASLITFSTVGDFSAATYGLTTIDFNGIAPANQFVSYGNGPLVLSGVTFTSNGSMFVIDPGYYGSSYAGGGFLNSDYASPDNIITAALGGSYTALGMNFGGLFGGPVTFMFNFSDGSSASVSASSSIFGNSLDFVGFTSSVAFSSVAIVMPDSPYYNAIDNFSFGTAVPEPGTLALFGLGLAGLGFARRRKLN